ncbi:MAG: hypothetical protein ACLBM4_02335, partial [Dolichospermum sp.]
MLIETLKQLYSSLVELIEQPTQKEEWYQSWFESNPEIFPILGLSDPVPHPYSVTIEEAVLIPDFLAKDRTGNWVIFELKRPDTNVHKGTDRRRIFYQDFNSYLAQCSE